MDLKDKVAIVTGSGRGIGEAIAEAMASEGAIVVVNDRKMGQAEVVAKKIEDKGGRAMPFEADVINKANLEAMVSETIRRYGTVDILVNNAGIEAPASLVQDISEEQWDRVLGVNLKGVFLASQAVIPTMIAHQKGKIINIASTAAIRMTFFGSADYTASKHAVAGFSQHLAWELADHHINVNVVCPGGVLTPLMEEGSTPQLRDTLTKRLVPLGRFCTPEEIAQTVIFLASEKSDMITGQLLAVDGGLLTGFGEDLRVVVRKRMEEMKNAKREPAARR